jgi:phosphatidylethanolamine-binding protein (PEBP) family uncharacterized protein
MKIPPLPFLGLLLPAFVSPLSAHLIGRDGSDPHPHYDWSVKPPEDVRAPSWFVAQADPAPSRVADESKRMERPSQAVPFEVFAPKVRIRWDAKYLYVESNGLPAHNLMVGITNWQQQVPLPQNYTGANAWRLPLFPVVAAVPVSIKNRFLRGAIALAANGIPIFNPQNNRGEIAQEIGELDQWGGHCGRADDYHYHAAPLHLQAAVGKGLPIAYALDGYAIYGLTEPDGTEPTGLDDYHGHSTPELGYHYHASTKYPYVNGGFHGEVVERDQQVDPQPRAQTIRAAGSPLRGAKITGFENSADTRFKLEYELNGDKRAIVYSVATDGTYPFDYQNGGAGSHQEIYTSHGSGPPPGGAEPVRKDSNEGRRPGPNGTGANEARPSAATMVPVPDAPAVKGFILTSPAVTNGGAYPVEFTGDGAGVTPPLDWTGVPEGTKSLVLIMHHAPFPGDVKYYWTLYNLPPELTHLDKNTQGVGSLGTGFRGKVGYEPPHSKGPGPKTYVLSLYALSAVPQIDSASGPVTPAVVIAAVKDHLLARTDLSVVYTRSGSESGERPVRPEDGPPPPPAR